MQSNSIKNFWSGALNNVQGFAGSAGDLLEQTKTNHKFKELAEKLQVAPFLVALEKINIQGAQQHVREISKKHPTLSPAEISHRLIQEKAVLLGAKGMACGILPGFAAGFLAVDMATAMVAQAELIYQIAYAYDLNLNESARKAEAVTIFGLAFGCNAAIGAGLGLVRNIPVAGALVGAGSNAVMTYAIGLAASHYYSAIHSGQSQEVAITQTLEVTEIMLEEALDQEAILDGILAHVVLASRPELAAADVEQSLEQLSFEPKARARISAHLKALKPFDELLGNLDVDYGIIALAQAEKLARSDAHITSQERELLDKLEIRFRQRIEALDYLQPSNYILTKEFKATIRGLQFSPDGVFLCACSDDRSVRIWKSFDDGKSFQPLHCIEAAHKKEIKAIAMSPDNDLLVTASADQTMAFWDYRNGRITRQLDSGHREGIYALAMTHNNVVASGSKDGEIKLWRSDTGAVRRSLMGHKAEIWCLAFNPTGEILASGSNDHTVRFWNPTTGEMIRVLANHPHGVYALAFSPDGKTLATGCWDRKIRIWNVETGEHVATWEGHSAAVWQLTFTSDGHHLISSADDNMIMIWDVATGRIRTRLDGHQNGVYALALSPVQPVIASGSWDQSLRIWNIDLE
jgi:uncharacterized protein (DUF697 family)